MFICISIYVSSGIIMFSFISEFLIIYIRVYMYVL